QFVERIYVIEFARDRVAVDPAAIVQQGDHFVPRSIEKEHLLQAIAVEVQPAHLDEVGATGPGQIELLPLAVHRHRSIEEQRPLQLGEAIGCEQGGKDQCMVKAHGVWLWKYKVGDPFVLKQTFPDEGSTVPRCMIVEQAAIPIEVYRQ